MTNVNNQTNETPFVKVIKEILGGDKQQENRELTLVGIMVNMETSFPLTWCKDYLRSAGTEKTAKLTAVLEDLYPGYVALVDDSQLKPNDTKDESQRAKLIEDKLLAQKTRKRLENMLRRAIFSVFYLRTNNASSTKVITKSGKIMWDEQKGEKVVEKTASRADLERWGQIEARTQELVKPAAVVSKPASPIKSLNPIVEMANSISTALRNKSALGDEQLEALRVLEGLLVKHSWTDSDGKFDVDGLTAFYQELSAEELKSEKKKAA